MTLISVHIPRGVASMLSTYNIAKPENFLDHLLLNLWVLGLCTCKVYRPQCYGDKLLYIAMA